MKPDADAPPYKSLWTPAMDEIEDDIDFAGVEYYELPNGERLYPGDQFWLDDERYLIEINDVKAKVRGDTHGRPKESVEDAPHYVFYDPDWQPPTPPHAKSHYTDDIHYVSVDHFVEALDEGNYVPHRNNGLSRRPP